VPTIGYRDTPGRAGTTVMEEHATESVAMGVAKQRPVFEGD
jgi:hypothetical protein